MSRRINRLPENWKDLPKLSTFDGNESYQLSGVRDYIRGWARLDELTTTQKNILRVLDNGASGRLAASDMAEYNSILSYATEQNILRPAELAILQRRGLHNKFLNSKVADNIIIVLYIFIIKLIRNYSDMFFTILKYDILD